MFGVSITIIYVKILSLMDQLHFHDAKSKTQIAGYQTGNYLIVEFYFALLQKEVSSAFLKNFSNNDFH